MEQLMQFFVDLSLLRKVRWCSLDMIYLMNSFEFLETNVFFSLNTNNKPKGGFPLFAETTRWFAEQFPVIIWVWQINEHRPSWSFKQRQLNQAITITLQRTEHAIIFLEYLSSSSHQSSFSAASSSLYTEPAMFDHCNHPTVRPFWTCWTITVVVLWRGIYSLRIAN